jgi:hypothetical protein
MAGGWCAVAVVAEALVAVLHAEELVTGRLACLVAAVDRGGVHVVHLVGQIAGRVIFVAAKIRVSF